MKCARISESRNGNWEHESAKRQNRSPNLAAWKTSECERTAEKIRKPIRLQEAARELAAEYLLPHPGTRPLVVGGDVRRGKADARGGGVPSLSLLRPRQFPCGVQADLRCNEESALLGRR